MNTSNFTKHAWQRLTQRFAGIVSVSEIEYALAGHKFNVGQSTLVVKDLGKVLAIETSDGCISRGNLVCLVIDVRYVGDPGKIVTIMLRKGTQPDRAHREHTAIPQHKRWA